MAVAPQIIYTILDDAGEQATTTINFPNLFSLSQIAEFGSDMATLMDAILGGKVLSADVCFSVDISALTSNTALSTSDVEEKGRFVFNTADGRAVNILVPCIDETKVVAGSHALDIADTDIAAFLSGIEDGYATPGGTIIPTDVLEDDILALRSATEWFVSRKRRVS